jgi:FdhD protein
LDGIHLAPQELLARTACGVDCLDREQQPVHRLLAEEMPVALVYNGSTMAVLMATPADLPDLAIGFSLTEGIVRDAGEIEHVESVSHDAGIELRMWLSQDRNDRLTARRRRLVGPTGCGLCGIESLADASPPVAPVAHAVSLLPRQISAAVQQLSDAQELNRATRATHAAGFYSPADGLMLLREDVGRHNALDKLAGALAAKGIEGRTGAVVMTSRVSIELVQKTAAIGAGWLIAVSAPTALAVRAAAACGITIVGIARGTDFQIFSHAEAVGLP